MKKLLTILLLVGVLFGQSDTLTFKVKGLVCSFCAHGLTKGIGKLSFIDEKSIYVDIENQIVKVALNENYKVIPHLKQTVEVIKESGYEVDKVFLNGDELE
jgi:mercuric ion binding protein